MKKIHLHTAAADNLGHFNDSGTSLTVSDRHQAGHIAEDRARALVASHGAIAEREPAQRKAPSSGKSPAPKKAAKATKAAPATSAAKASEPGTGAGQA